MFLLQNIIFIFFHHPQQPGIGSTVFPKIYNQSLQCFSWVFSQDISWRWNDFSM